MSNTSVLNMDRPIETLPAEPLAINDSLEQAIALADKQVEILQQVLKISLRRTNERDWVDQQGNPYLTASGAEKLMPVFGVSMRDVVYEKTLSSDDEGKYYIYQYQGHFAWKGGSIIAVGTCSSRDKFFAWNSIDKTYKPDSQIDETNIMKAAYSNMIVNGVTRLLGIRNLTWPLLNQSGIDQGKVSRVEYKSPKTDSPDDVAKQKEVADMLLEIAGQDKIQAVEKLKEITAFQGKDGNMVPGLDSTKKLTGKRLDIAHSKVKKEYEQFQSQMRAAQ